MANQLVDLLERFEIEDSMDAETDVDAGGDRAGSGFGGRTGSEPDADGPVAADGSGDDGDADETPGGG